MSEEQLSLIHPDPPFRLGDRVSSKTRYQGKPGTVAAMVYTESLGWIICVDFIAVGQNLQCAPEYLTLVSRGEASNAGT